MNNLHPAFAAALAPFAPPGAFTEAQLLEADRYLAGPARDPQFFDRKTELYEQRSQQEAERLELLHIREAVGAPCTAPGSTTRPTSLPGDRNGRAA